MSEKTATAILTELCDANATRPRRIAAGIAASSVIASYVWNTKINKLRLARRHA